MIGVQWNINYIVNNWSVLANHWTHKYFHWISQVILCQCLHLHPSLSPITVKFCRVPCLVYFTYDLSFECAIPVPCPVNSCPRIVQFLVPCPVDICPYNICPILSIVICPVNTCPVSTCPVNTCPVNACPVNACPVNPCLALCNFPSLMLSIFVPCCVPCPVSSCPRIVPGPLSVPCPVKFHCQYLSLGCVKLCLVLSKSDALPIIVPRYSVPSTPCRSACRNVNCMSHVLVVVLAHELSLLPAVLLSWITIMSALSCFVQCRELALHEYLLMIMIFIAGF